MGEEMQMMVFCDGEEVGLSTEPMELCEDAGDNEWVQPEPFSAEWYATVSNDEMLEELRKLWAKPSRKFTRGEKRLFIRTVEHYGAMEFTLHDWRGIVDGEHIDHITLVCDSPRQVKLLLRMKNLGKVSYKIRKKYDTGRNKKDCRNAAHD